MEAWITDSKNPLKKRGACAVGCATNACGVCETYAHSGLSPVFPAQSSQVDLRVGKILNLKHSPY